MRHSVHQMWGYVTTWSWWSLIISMIACKVPVYAYIVLCTDSSLGLGLNDSWSVMVRCFNLSMRCISSAGVDLGSSRFQAWELVLVFRLLVVQCFNYSANAHWVSVFSQFSSDFSLSSTGIGCSSGTRSRGYELWVAGISSVSWLQHLVVMVCVFWHIPKLFSRAFKGDCLWSQDICMLQWKCRL